MVIDAVPDDVKDSYVDLILDYIEGIYVLAVITLGQMRGTTQEF